MSWWTMRPSFLAITAHFLAKDKAIRAAEKARQFDRQREEMHPLHVLEVLESLAPPPRESLRLPKATPDPQRASSGQPLVIRYREKAVDQ